jgi:hypothetical protein
VPFGWIPPSLRALARTGLRTVPLVLADGVVHRIDGQADMLYEPPDPLHRDASSRYSDARDQPGRTRPLALAFVSNKHTHEWGHAPSNFIALPLLASLLELLARRFFVIYSRPGPTDIADDDAGATQNATSNTHRATSNMQHAQCSIQHPTCTVQHPTCNMHSAAATFRAQHGRRQRPARGPLSFRQRRNSASHKQHPTCNIPTRAARPSEPSRSVYRRCSARAGGRLRRRGGRRCGGRPRHIPAGRPRRIIRSAASLHRVAALYSRIGRSPSRGLPGANDCRLLGWALPRIHPSAPQRTPAYPSASTSARACGQPGRSFPGCGGLTSVW